MTVKTVKDRYRGTTESHRAFSRLITAAKYRGTVTYQELAKVLGLPLKGSHMGREIGHLLGEISEDEVQAGRPMLSAIAVNVEGKPGPGFFGLARTLGRLHDDEDETSFWKAEVDAVYDTWKEGHETYQPES